MSEWRALPALIALLLAAVLVSACGGSDDEATTASTVATDARSTTTTPSRTSAREARDERGIAEDSGSTADDPGSSGEGNTSSMGGGKPSSRGEGKPASLATDPTSIQGARVTAKGAVQTLPPSAAAQQEAMENSYASIKAFGSEAEGSEATDITFALAQYLSAKAGGDWATACARLYSVLRENLEKSSPGNDCAQAYGDLMSRSPAASRAEAARIDVASVRRGEGNRAFVIYKTPATLSADMPMYLEGDLWTVGALEAYILTPQQLEAGE
jgi:hypothetical protein